MSRSGCSTSVRSPHCLPWLHFLAISRAHSFVCFARVMFVGVNERSSSSPSKKKKKAEQPRPQEGPREICALLPVEKDGSTLIKNLLSNTEEDCELEWATFVEGKVLNLDQFRIGKSIMVMLEETLPSCYYRLIFSLVLSIILPIQLRLMNMII